MPYADDDYEEQLTEDEEARAEDVAFAWIVMRSCALIALALIGCYWLSELAVKTGENVGWR